MSGFYNDDDSSSYTKLEEKLEKLTPDQDQDRFHKVSLESSSAPPAYTLSFL
jgi:hypothetical protein